MAQYTEGPYAAQSARAFCRHNAVHAFLLTILMLFVFKHRTSAIEVAATQKSANIMRKTGFAFATFLMMLVLACATTVLNVSRTFSAASQNSEIYGQLNLFGG